MQKQTDLIVIGGGLAGCEAAWQAANRGVHVTLYEMRPLINTPAHTTNHLAEIICSNSFGSNLRNRPAGLLKTELRRLNSFILRCAEETALPAGGALAVDRERFASLVTNRLEDVDGLEIIREKITEIPQTPCIIASGPLTSPGLAENIANFLGTDFLYFYDAIAPIVEFDSIDMKRAFWASRYQRDQEGQGDYLNCPMTQQEYEHFIAELTSAKKVALRSFERDDAPHPPRGNKGYFEACLPVEVLAARDIQALSYGPLRPVGITDPRDGSHPFAVLQLRQDNLAKSLFNMVGFQTNLTYPEQDRVFRLIPGLEHVVFTRYGQMHRNTYINSPQCLRSTLQHRQRADLFFAGQITGVEGYTNNIASGLLAGINASRFLNGKQTLEFPCETMTGSLMHYISHADPANFQPMKANFGLLPDLPAVVRNKREKGFAFTNRALKTLDQFNRENQIV